MLRKRNWKKLGKSFMTKMVSSSGRGRIHHRTAPSQKIRVLRRKLRV